MRYLNPEKLYRRLEERLADDMADGRVGGTGLCVMQEGREVYKAYHGQKSYEAQIPLTAENGEGTIFRLASMTKPITATAVLIQVARGKLQLDEPITGLLPQFADMDVGELKDGKVVFKEKAKRVFTPRILLNHTNGVGVGDIGAAQDGRATPADRHNLENVVNFYAGTMLAFQPTEAQGYSGTAAFDVAARLVELTSGMPYDEFVKKHIFDPLGMTDTTFTPTEEQWSRFIAMHTRREVDGHGVSGDGSTVPGCVFEDFPTTWFSGGAGLAATLPDYVNFAEMLQRGGKTADGQEIVPEALIRQMGTAWVPYEIMPAWEQWGLGVRVITNQQHWLPVTTFGWSGAYGSHFWVDPVNKITAVYMKNSRYDGGAGSQTSIHFEQDVYASLE